MNFYCKEQTYWSREDIDSVLAIGLLGVILSCTDWFFVLLMTLDKKIDDSDPVADSVPVRGVILQFRFLMRLWFSTMIPLLTLHPKQIQKRRIEEDHLMFILVRVYSDCKLSNTRVTWRTREILDSWTRKGSNLSRVFHLRRIPYSPIILPT